MNTSIETKTISFMTLCKAWAKEQDAIPQPPFKRDPEEVLTDEASFRAWQQGKDGILVNQFRDWFKKETGIIVAESFSDGFGFRPKHNRNVDGVWTSWGKYPKWFTRMREQYDKVS